MPQPCQVIFFDAAGTLIYLPRTVGDHYRQVALSFGVAPDAAVIERAFRAAWKAAPIRLSTEGPRPDDDKGWWRDLVGKVFDTVLTPDERRRFDLPAYFERVYAHFAEPGVWAAYPDTLADLGGLRADGYRLGVISNFDRRLLQVLGDLKISEFFEHVVISSEVGADKPDRQIFQRALDLFGVAPGSCVHVGDEPLKDGGAEGVGMRVFHLERPRHRLADVRTFLAEN